MSQVNIGGTTLSFKDSSFTGDQWESVASWVLNGGAEECEKYAKEAKSYAKGGTATREGEDTDNAKYYKEQAAGLVADAQSSANVASASEINAEASKEAAAGFAENARDEADRAVAASAHPPKISSDGYWELWNLTQSAYVKTTYPSRGPKGEGLKIDGTAPTYAQLPTLTASDAGKAYMVVSDGRLYIWDGTAWPADGAGLLIKGEDGVTPNIGANGNWFIGTEDTGVSAQGPAGKDGTLAEITGAASTIASADLTAKRALVSNASGKVGVASTTLQELNYLHGVTSEVQAQLDAKQDKIMANGFLRGDGAGNVTADNPVYIVPIKIIGDTATIISDDTYADLYEKLAAGYLVILQEESTSNISGIRRSVFDRYVCDTYQRMVTTGTQTTRYSITFYRWTNSRILYTLSSLMNSTGQNTFTISTQQVGMNPSATPITLPAMNWIDGVNAIGIETSTDATIWTAQSNGFLRISQTATDEQFAAWCAAQPRVTAQGDNTITIKAAGTVPTIDIPVEVLIV